MKVELWLYGKTSESYIAEGMALYENRLKHYLQLQVSVLPSVKNAGKLPPQQLMAKEAEILLKQLNDSDFLVLMDERGRELSSVKFANWLEQQQHHGHRRLIFVVGGAWGFDESLRQRANFSLSLSKMTFSHQMVRLFFLEQLYRAMTILRGEKYHNE